MQLLIMDFDMLVPATVLSTAQGATLIVIPGKSKWGIFLHFVDKFVPAVPLTFILCTKGSLMHDKGL